MWPAWAALLLGRQLRDELERPLATGPKGRARALERRAVERLSAGKTAAAMRTLRHSLALRETAQPGDALLFKGSRSMKMENALKLFLGEEVET